MIQTIYIENEVRDHPRTHKICARFPKATLISCDGYSSVFNNNAQNFRLQKQNPALILAKKHQKYVLPTPPGYGIGGDRNYYFSHMLNCVYDCRYCFLQGMYRSANYVVFVNYEDYFEEITATTSELAASTWFFSGYDCDSMAMEPVTGFMADALDHFEKLPSAYLEIRTKSTQIRTLLNRTAIPNAVAAFSFSPEKISQNLEYGVPGLEKRINAMKKLQDKNWKIGLRLDPIIYSPSLQSDYEELLQRIFSSIDAARIHSVSYGMFRLPKPFFKKMVKLYPKEKLFSMPLTEHESQVSFSKEIETESHNVVHTALLNHIDDSLIFPCN